MSALSTMLTTKKVGFTEAEEQNLEKGRIYTYTQGANWSRLWCGFCFHPEVAGTVYLESWGAGGSGGKMCCCGFGLPGNSAAYAYRKFDLGENGFICGCTGQSCGNADTLCHRGCSEPTFMNISTGLGECTCVCTQGGAGGVSYCSTNTSFYCCFAANGFCATKTDNDHCGWVCNMCDGKHIAQAYCGDAGYNCPGRTSCVAAFGCYPLCICNFTHYAPTPAGMFSKEGLYVAFNTENNNGFSDWSGQGAHQLEASLGAGRWPTGGIPWATCWGASKGCHCQIGEPCIPHVPVGMGGHGSMPCPQVRDHASRGGHGGVRIKFIRNDEPTQ